MKTFQKTRGKQLKTLIEILGKVSFKEIPKKVKTSAKLVVLDTLGAILLGNRAPYIRKLAAQWKIPNYRPFSTILGYDFHTFSHMAGFINGSGGTVHDLDEGHRFSRGHPGIYVIPAALAIGEELGISGKSFLQSVILGYELTAKIAMAMQPLKPQFQTHGTWGTFGAAYITGLLLNFSHTQLEQSIQGAGALCMSPSCSADHQGATIRNLYAGFGIMNGILSTVMVKANVSAPKDGLQTYTSVLGDDSLDMDLLLGDVATYYEITRNYFKIHAACAHVHSSADAMEKILKEKDFKPHNIRKIFVKTYSEASKLCQSKYLDPLSAKFSIPYVLSTLILFRDTGHTAFEKSKIKEVEASGLLEKIEISLEPNYENPIQNLRPSMVEVHLNNGTTISSICSLPKGNFDNPYSSDDILRKFKSITEPLLGRMQQHELIDYVKNLENVKDIRELINFCHYQKF